MACYRKECALCSLSLSISSCWCTECGFTRVIVCQCVAPVCVCVCGWQYLV